MNQQWRQWLYQSACRHDQGFSVCMYSNNGAASQFLYLFLKHRNDTLPTESYLFQKIHMGITSVLYMCTKMECLLCRQPHIHLFKFLKLLIAFPSSSIVMATFNSRNYLQDYIKPSYFLLNKQQTFTQVHKYITPSIFKINIDILP